ncbi:SusD/RagB family nutrient-binding outer membrane lipoprotein [Pedobacter sp. KBW06]|uniref:SusD/RagB family nutrient-binding outer membrane lipoprotein n=1 Tax=Pedobacter sp. KBW06 TaxID=2153359 RepID=UPI000F59F657|nr:SusD/RagB family nutrient-binding outer membrane lipoprotein [Pedobacter sp. KBW06]RQO65817.1 SusD/RagB family nutrient-binding outer membrane lipoprotein [Pedobacter sp. KBW06]
MKKIAFYLCLMAILTIGCTKGFEELNRDPTKANEGNMDPNYLLTSGQLNYGNITEFQLYELAPMMQVLASTATQTSYSAGDKYSSQLFSYNDRFFADGQIAAGLFAEAQELAEKKDPVKYANLIQVSRIMRVMAMQRITDTYGDIPYAQKNGTLYPKYDLQADIYKDMLATLEDAAGKLDKTKTKMTGDLFYDGDIDKWTRFTYSLMLRVAMRLTKADPDMARAYAEKTKDKTFKDFTDNAILKFNGTAEERKNKSANSWFGDAVTFGQVRWSKTFIDFLKNNNDPRLYVITEKSDTGMVFNNDLTRPAFGYTQTKPAPAGKINEVPVGMPNGYDINGVRSIETAPGYPGATGKGNNASPLGNYARPLTKVFAQPTFSTFLITYAETELLLAEAKARGWDVGAVSAKDHYRNGLVAAMRSLEQLNGMLTMGTEVETFAAAHPLDESSLEKSLEMINTQYWVATLFNFPETWANYRRSGYPVLTPVNYPGNRTNGVIPRRLNYPNREASYNAANYNEAVSRLGGNDLDLTKRVWWDK